MSSQSDDSQLVASDGQMPKANSRLATIQTPAISAIKEVQNNADYQASFMRLTIGERSILRHTSVCSRRSENDQKGPPGPRDLNIEF
jgi:hypothetical protein